MKLLHKAYFEEPDDLFHRWIINSLAREELNNKSAAGNAVAGKAFNDENNTASGNEMVLLSVTNAKETNFTWTRRIGNPRNSLDFNYSSGGIDYGNQELYTEAQKIAFQHSHPRRLEAYKKLEAKITENRGNRSKVLAELFDVIQTTQSEVDINEEEDIFSDRIIYWFKQYPDIALIIMREYYENGSIGEGIISHILMALGNIDERSTYNERLSQLEYFLNSESSMIRYGAIIGISNLNANELALTLTQRLEDEHIPALRGALKATLRQFQHA